MLEPRAMNSDPVPLRVPGRQKPGRPSCKPRGRSSRKYSAMANRNNHTAAPNVGVTGCFLLARNPRTFYVEVYPVQTGLGGQIQRLVIVIAPSQVVGMHRGNDGPQVLALRGYHPNSSRA
jgi:hypothetical protein